ncbi:FAD-linked oxidase C-terminal domain-containing protein, partial [Pseudomonas protegens]
LWRLSVPHNTPLLPLPGEQLLDWGGAQRWLKTDATAADIRAVVSAVGGHASCYSHGLLDSPFQPLAPTLLHYHQRLKAQLDPQGIFNPGRLYVEL